MQLSLSAQLLSPATVELLAVATRLKFFKSTALYITKEGPFNTLQTPILFMPSYISMIQLPQLTFVSTEIPISPANCFLSFRRYVTNITNLAESTAGHKRA
jgi:hypothetical protein